VLTAESLDKFGAELKTVFKTATGVYRQREFQQNCCFNDRTEQLWLTNRVTQIVKPENFFQLVQQLHLVDDGEIDPTFALLRDGVLFYLNPYVKSQNDVFPMFAHEVALRDAIGGVWYIMSPARIIGLPFFLRP
jgi:hypothetical protein